MGDARKIHWTFNEREALCQIVADMRMSQPDADLLTLFRNAQQQFPPDRRRSLRALKNVQDLVLRVQLMLRDRLVSKDELPPDQRTSAPQTLDPVPPSLETTSEVVASSVEDVLEDTPLPVMLAVTIRRIFTEI